ncbi:hypothetical protein [Sulfurospirillum cavolei]|uniref:hypothetical protein n=1 Tax=Sulfurospirillum cavolei TaxID=366522 RepID=UPI0005A719A6|nr:hypothetical protein [Sulfurospirillum cavolei]
MSASYIILKENHEKQSTTATNVDTNTTVLQGKNQTQTVLEQASTNIPVKTLNLDMHDFMLIVALLFLAQAFLRLLEKAMEKLVWTIRTCKQKKEVSQSQSLNANEAHEPKGLDTPSFVLPKDHQ